ncbi:MAG: hypothetical protein ACUVX8_16720 [Candidatus Zipacnadales bacterium]
MSYRLAFGGMVFGFLYLKLFWVREARVLQRRPFLNFRPGFSLPRDRKP